MPPRQTKKPAAEQPTTSAPADPAPVLETPVVQAPAPADAKPKRSRKTASRDLEAAPTVETSVLETPVVEEILAAAVPETPAVEETPAKERKSRIVNAQVLQTELSAFLGLISAEIDRLNLSENKTSARFLKSLLKRAAEIQKHVLKFSTSKKNHRKSNPNVESGILKAVPITVEMAKFMKVPADTLVSRVDGMKAIHAYIKEKELQRPDNKKFILPDKRLATLLGYTAVEGDEGLNYSKVVKYMQPLFVKKAST